MIPVNSPKFGELEKKYLAECIDTGWVSTEGPFVKEFEKKISHYLGLSHAFAVSSGTAALETACYAVGIGAGDEVIMPSFTIISCAAAIIRAGGKPVLIDSDPETWNMDIRQIEKKITPRTKAIMVVHLYGFPVDMPAVMQIARQHNLKVIEDCAQSFGASINGQLTGTFGDIMATSFFANKIITTGEGGMAVTGNEEIAKRAANYRNLFFGTTHRFIHEELSYNFRMSNLQAAVGLGQFEMLPAFVQHKIKMGEKYDHAFADLKVKLPPKKPGMQNVYWMYGLELDPSLGVTSAEMARRLADKKIQTRPFFVGMHKQPALLKRGFFAGEKYQVCEQMSEYGLYIPSGLGLTTEQQDTVIKSVRECLGQ